VLSFRAIVFNIGYGQILPEILGEKSCIQNQTCPYGTIAPSEFLKITPPNTIAAAQLMPELEPVTIATG
jgi:hypothetical protein